MSIHANWNEKQYMWILQVGVKHIHQDNYWFNLCECLLNVSQSVMYSGDTKMYKSTSLPLGAFDWMQSFDLWDPGLCFLVLSGQRNI